MERPFIPDGSPPRPSQISRKDFTEIESSGVTPQEVADQYVLTSKENLASYTPPGSPSVESHASYQNPLPLQRSNHSDSPTSLVRKPIGDALTRAHDGHTQSGSQKIRKEPQHGFPSSKSLSSSSMPSQTGRAALPSQLPKSPDGVFGDKMSISLRNLPGAQMIHLSSPKQPPIDNLGLGLSRQHYLNDDKVGSSGNSSATLPLRQQHERNKTTVSDFSDMMKPMKVDSQSPVVPSREIFESKDLVPSHHPSQSTSSSWHPEARPKAGHQRMTSEDSTDSNSTVASDSWNPVDEYMASSSDDTLAVSNAMSLFNFGTSFQSRQELNRTTGPAHFSWVGLSDTYALSRMELAGHNHGVAVYDAAYVTGKIPETEEEWTTVQLAPGSGSMSPRNAFITYGSSDLGLHGNKFPAEDAVTVEKEEDIQKDCSMSVDNEVLLQPTVYEPPNTGCVFDYACSSDRGDEVSTRRSRWRAAL